MSAGDEIAELELDDELFTNGGASKLETNNASTSSFSADDDFEDVYDLDDTILEEDAHLVKAPTVRYDYHLEDAPLATEQTSKTSSKSKSLKKQPTKHVCSTCEREFKTKKSLESHTNTHTGERPHKCTDCTSAFTTKTDLDRHVRYKHTMQRPHKCSECDYASVELSKLRRHIRTHTGERPYQCPHCTYASPDNFKLKRHMRVHTGERPYTCDICQASFSQLNSMQMHRRIHSSIKVAFQCPECPATCGRKSDLRLHMQSQHDKSKPQTCALCQQVLPDRYALKTHIKTHEGERLFKCAECSYSATSQRLLTSHMNVHSEAQLYPCPDCQNLFRSTTLLQHHRKKHAPHCPPQMQRQKLNRCPHCERTFAHKGNLMRHLDTHNAPKVEVELEVKRYVIKQEVKTDPETGEIDVTLMEVSPTTHKHHVPEDVKKSEFLVEVPGETQYPVLEVDYLDDSSRLELDHDDDDDEIFI